MIAPTPKKPSTVFMIDVCWAVDVEMSPMSASAPVLKTPMARPDSAQQRGEEQEGVAGGEQEAGGGEQREADDDRGAPAEPVRELTEQQAGEGDAGHRRVLKRAGRRQRQTETS